MFDIEDYLSPGKPVDLVEFLLGVAGAVSDHCETAQVDLGIDAASMAACGTARSGFSAGSSRMN